MKANSKSRIVMALDSTAVISLEYNPTLKRLTVFFRNSGVYQYENVPADVFGELVSKESLGSAVNQLIVGRFESSRLITPDYGASLKV